MTRVDVMMPVHPLPGRLREVALDHLRRCIALPLEPPRDWAWADMLVCRCNDCRDFGVFLVDPGRQHLRLTSYPPVMVGPDPAIYPRTVGA